MARKITLSIPDMLHEKMEDWRQSFNLSKMFQDALTEAIHKKEEFQRRLQEDQNMSDIIERLRKEKKQSEGSFFETGKLKGVQWAKHAHYDDLIHVVDTGSPGELLQTGPAASELSALLEKEQFNEAPWAKLDRSARLLMEGWHRGVMDFWTEIKEKL